MNPLRCVIAILPVLLSMSIAYAQLRSGVAPEFERRMADLQRAFNGESGVDTLFAPSFLKQVPVAQVRSILDQVVAGAGRCTAVTVRKVHGRYSASIDATFERNMTGDLEITVEQTYPYRIIGLLLKGLRPVGKSPDNLDSLVAMLRSFPGRRNLLIVRLDDGRTVAGLDADTVLAIGSAFKLYILGELVARTNEGTARWSDAITYDTAAAQPGGTFGRWPQGGPVTLHTAATLMISQSDNTATDMMLAAMGRESVEHRMPVMRHHAAARNVPFLSTREAFKLKSTGAAGLAARYIAGDSSRRRAVLRQLADTTIAYDFGDRPAYIEHIEWFASARDLCAAMDWLRANTTGNELARGVLALNPGLQLDPDRWRYVGYKGGSEPGVLNMTWVLRSQAGAWYAVSIGWNNPAAALDETAFFALVQRILNTGPWE